MTIKKQVANYFVEVIGLAIFILAIYRIVIILFSEPLTELWYYIFIAIFSLFLMNYMNLPHHIGQKWKNALSR